MFEVVGAFTIGCLLLAVILLVLKIALNIICAALGAIRFRRVLKVKTATPAAWWWVARTAVSHWYGPRYNGHAGEYWVAGGLEVPMDIRDKVRRSHFYGA